jgi:hypothetical protein
MKVNNTAIIRAKLNTWTKRLTRARFPEFHYLIKQLWAFLQNNPVLSSLCERLEKREPSHQEFKGAKWRWVLNTLFVQNWPNRSIIRCTDEQDHYAFCYHVIKYCVEELHANHAQEKLAIEMEFARHYHSESPTVSPRLLYTYFLDNIVRPLVIHLQESLESNRVILVLLQRYKHKCEWFQKKQLNIHWKSVKSKGESLLHDHLQEYLFDNGVLIYREPKSPSGKADVVSGPITPDEHEPEKIVADVKLITKAGEGKSTIVKGFNQTLTYTFDHEDPFGYLIVFNAYKTEHHVAGDGNHRGIPYIEHHGRTIYIIIIDICLNRPSASKRGKLSSVMITKNEFISQAETTQKDERP